MRRLILVALASLIAASSQAAAATRSYTIRASPRARLVHRIAFERAEPVAIRHGDFVDGSDRPNLPYATFLAGSGAYAGALVLARIDELPPRHGVAVRAIGPAIQQAAVTYADVVGSNPRVTIRGNTAVLANRRHPGRRIGMILTDEHWPGGDAVVTYQVPRSAAKPARAARLVRRLTFATNPRAEAQPGYAPTTSGDAVTAMADLDTAMAAQPHFRASYRTVGPALDGATSFEFDGVPGDAYFVTRFPSSGGPGELLVQKAGSAWVANQGAGCYEVVNAETPEQLGFASYLGERAARVHDGAALRTLIIVGYSSSTADQPRTQTYTIDRATGTVVDDIVTDTFDGRTVSWAGTYDYATPVVEVVPSPIC